MIRLSVLLTNLHLVRNLRRRWQSTAGGAFRVVEHVIDPELVQDMTAAIRSTHTTSGMQLYMQMTVSTLLAAGLGTSEVDRVHVHTVASMSFAREVVEEVGRCVLCIRFDVSRLVSRWYDGPGSAGAPSTRPLSPHPS